MIVMRALINSLCHAFDLHVFVFVLKFQGTFATDLLESKEVAYASVIVLVLTSVWSYVLTNLVMSGKSKEKTG